MSDASGSGSRMGSISVVTPTLHRAPEVRGLLENLRAQTLQPAELLLIDGAAPPGDETQALVAEAGERMPFRCRYWRRGGGTAIQRNVGIDQARGDYVAFIDDDIRLEPDFFERIMAVYSQDTAGRVGGVAGYIVNQHLDPTRSPRWRWYRRLRLFTTYEPGRFDYRSGYPINRYLQPPHDGVREIDFMGANCAVWRRAVFAGGLRFSEFFTGYGVLEDAHLALRARRHWKLLECGRARCVHLRAADGREDSGQVAWKSAVNYRFVFLDIVPDRSLAQELRFWRVQLFDLARLIAYAMRFPSRDHWRAAAGKARGILAAARMRRAALIRAAPGSAAGA